MQTTGYRNCTVCTRWRPVSDFTPRRREGDTLRKLDSRCRPCRNANQRAKYADNPTYREQRKRHHREHQAVKRREAGIPVRPVGKFNKGKYGAGRIGPEENVTPEQLSQREIWAAEKRKQRAK